MTRDGKTLSGAQRRALDAVCRRIVPMAYEPGFESDLTAEVEAKIATLDPSLARQMAGALTIFDHPVTGLLMTGRARRFSSLPPEEQDGCLEAWETSRVAARRQVYEALRRIIAATCYTLPEARERIGYAGPLHRRAPQFSWEGPVTGEPEHDDEPVARVPAGSEATVIMPAPPNLKKDSSNGSSGARFDGRLEGVVQGRDLGSETVVKTGVCVVGTGAGGAVAAARLAEAGHEVVMLEEGGYYEPSEFNEDEGDMSARLYAEGASRATDDLSFAMLQGRCVGGGTTVNWMIMLRAFDRVLDEWEREHGTYGMGPSEMAPVYERIEDEVHARRVPDDAHSPNNRIILDGAAKLGWRAKAGNINAVGCVRSGFCGLGCRYGAKQTTQHTYLPRAMNAGASLYSDVRVDRIEQPGKGGRAPLKRLRCTVIDRETGEPRGRLVVEAPIVILAAGAVGTPTILQRSGMGGGGVGKYLRLHPTTAVLGFYDREIYASGGMPLTAVCDEFLLGSESGYGPWIECPPPHPSLGATAIPGFGERHQRYMDIATNTGTLIALVRDGADKQLSNGEVRARRASAKRGGRPSMRYRLGPSDTESMISGIEASARLHLAEGANEVLTLHGEECRLHSERDIPKIRQQKYGPNRLMMFSAHVNGTCRIGTDPRTSGATPDGERHGVPGLYIADGSLLPTGLGANPQETIMAISSVISERIAETHPV